MCGRFGLKASAGELQRAFALESAPDDFPPRYNIAPTQQVLAVVAEGERRRAAAFRWGLIPSWAKDASIGSRMINARGETLSAKPAFRAAFRSRRCLVPASGFFEWKREGSGKVPHWITTTDGSLLAFAGLWESWHSPDGEVRSLAIVTTAPNALLSAIHDRMPVILFGGGRDRWLSPASAPAELQPLIGPCADESLRAHPVSTLVNSPANDLPACIESLAADG
jgi:putative SOS response-associated peptidase YedK